jgi:hypothetical protein
MKHTDVSAAAAKTGVVPFSLHGLSTTCKTCLGTAAKANHFLTITNGFRSDFMVSSH